MQFDTLIFKFRDASVPPPYHRSYTITLTQHSISKWVHSYGETVSLLERALTTPEFEQVQNQYSISKIAPSVKPEQKGPQPTGGTGMELTCYLQEKEVFSGSLEKCAGQTTGTISGDIDALRNLLNELAAKDVSPT